jgi:CRISPR-associated endonuclease Csy4
MDHFVDIEVRPDPEFPANQLMSVLFAKLHRGLVGLRTTGIGVSFPKFDVTPPNLGTCLRLHGQRSVLLALMESDWLNGMRDHVVQSVPSLVPSNTQHRNLRRIQTKSSPARLRRRLMHRHDLNEQEALQRIPNEVARFSRLPFVQLRSTSTGQNFRVFFDNGPFQPSAVPGDFNAYGFSQTATIPWF